MSFYIYGLRLKGAVECRYVGQTGKGVEARFAQLNAEAKHRVKHDVRVHPESLWQWLSDNAGNVEVFKIGKVRYRPEAFAMEKAIIALVLRLEHRLFNIAQVPAEKQLGHIRTRHSQALYERRLAREAMRQDEAA